MGVRVGDLIEAANDPIKVGAIERNPDFIRLIRDEVNRYMYHNKSRMGVPKGLYHDIPTGVSSYYGYIGRDTSLTTFFVSVDHLRTLVRFQLLGLDDELMIRQIDWFSGSGAYLNLNNYGEIERLRRLGLPGRGQFVPTDRRLEKFHDKFTFTGTDATVLAVMGDSIMTLRNISGFSYSIHRGKPAVRTLGKTSKKGSGRATRTIAGTLIFTETDEHPLLPLYPSAILPKDMEYIKGTTQHHQSFLLGDQLPAFDLFIIWQNEYGSAKQLAIYGIEIMDEGSSRQDKDMQEEVVFNYTAFDMDPVRRVAVDRDGTVDPFGINDPGLSSYWQRRWLAASSLGIHNDPYTITTDYYDDIRKKWEAPPKRKITQKIPPTKTTTITDVPPVDTGIDIPKKFYDPPTEDQPPVPISTDPNDPNDPGKTTVPGDPNKPIKPDNPVKSNDPNVPVTIPPGVTPPNPNNPPNGVVPPTPVTPSNPNHPGSNTKPKEPNTPGGYKQKDDNPPIPPSIPPSDPNGPPVNTSNPYPPRRGRKFDRNFDDDEKKINDYVRDNPPQQQTPPSGPPVTTPPQPPSVPNNTPKRESPSKRQSPPGGGSGRTKTPKSTPPPTSGRKLDERPKSPPPPPKKNDAPCRVVESTENTVAGAIKGAIKGLKEAFEGGAGSGGGSGQVWGYGGLENPEPDEQCIINLDDLNQEIGTNYPL